MYRFVLLLYLALIKLTIEARAANPPSAKDP